MRTQCALAEGIDFDLHRFEEAEWKNMLLAPIVTQHGTYVLTVAGAI